MRRAFDSRIPGLCAFALLASAQACGTAGEDSHRVTQSRCDSIVVGETIAKHADVHPGASTCYMCWFPTDGGTVAAVGPVFVWEVRSEFEHERKVQTCCVLLGGDVIADRRVCTQVFR